jgi:transposase
LTALIGELSGSQRDSRSAVQAFCRSVPGVRSRRGAIQRAVDRVSEAITPYYGAIAQKTRIAKVNYIDETFWHQHGVLAWLWVMVNTTVALFIVQANRSQAAFEALVERWAGILVSDGYVAYRQWLHQRQTCLAHLIRRARGLSEWKEPELARFGRRVMAELQRLVLWTTAPPTSGEVQTWCTRMVHLIDQYRPRRDEAGTFARTLERELGALWTFTVEEGVEPTNNRAERALRFAVLWRKMMQGTYNAKGDRWVERILSVRETCRLRGRPTFPVLVEAVTHSFNGQHPDVPGSDPPNTYSRPTSLPTPQSSISLAALAHLVSEARSMVCPLLQRVAAGCPHGRWHAGGGSRGGRCPDAARACPHALGNNTGDPSRAPHPRPLSTLRPGTAGSAW